MSQVGIDPKETTTTKEVDGSNKDKSDQNDSDSDSGSNSDDNSGDNKDDSDKNDSSSTAVSPSSDDVKELDDAVQKVRDAKNSGSFEDYGKALDELQKALEKYQSDTGSSGSTQLTDTEGPKPSGSGS